MTKIKDLAVLAVDSAFTLFPIDSERYELRAVLSDICTFGAGESTSKDARVNQWLLGLQQRLLQAATCFHLAHNSDGKDLSALDRDRARRVEATLYNWCEERMSRLRVAKPEVIQDRLLWAVCYALVNADVENSCSPERTGGNP